MKVFYHQQKKIFILINLKVMYSSFCYCRELTELTRHVNKFNRIINRAYIATKFLMAKERYILTRNPYSRLFSFYNFTFKDFFVAGECLLLKCQEFFLPYFDDKKYFLENKKKFLDTSFEDFVRILAKIYMQDEHICPQHYIVDKFKPLLKEIKVIRMEDEANLKSFAETIGLDLKKRINNTDKYPRSYSLSAETLNIIHGIYKKDFYMFNYKMKEA